jgi:hypothetical protein
MLHRITCTSFGLLFLFCMLLFVGCSGGGNATLVTVTDFSGNQVAGVTVVLGDSNGVMKTYGTTNAAGQIAFTDPPANATITAAHSCLQSGETDTIYSLDTHYDVNGLVALNVITCPGSSNAYPDGSGTVTINMTNVLDGITQYELITIGQPLIGPVMLLATQATVTITPFDLQSDGKLSLVVVGRDANGTAIGYGALLDQTFVDGMTVNIAVNQPMGSVQYHISNVPATAASLCPEILQVRTGKGSLFFMHDCLSLSSGTTSTTVAVPYMPGIGDQFMYEVSVNAYQYDANNRFSDSDQFIGINGPPAAVPSDQMIDLSQALAVPSLVVSGETTSTPSFSWSGVDPDTVDTQLHTILSLPSGALLFFNIYGISSTRTDITFPELPDSLAEFRPTGVVSAGLETSADTAELLRWSTETYYSAVAFPAQAFDPAMRKLRAIVGTGRTAVE